MTLLSEGTAEVPARADGVTLIGEMAGSGYRQPPALVRRGDGQTFQLTALLYLLLQAVDGRRTYEQVAGEVSAASGRLVRAEQVRALVDARLRPLGLVRLADGSQPPTARSEPLLGLRFRYAVTDPQATRRLTAPFTPLFHPLVAVPLLAAFIAVSWWLLFDKGLASATYEAFEKPALLMLIFAVSVLSAGFHEFGHAAAARYGGATPGAMGMGVYLVWPAFYTDVTDSYRLGRGGRLRTDLGGLYFNVIVAVGIVGVWRVTGYDALLLVVVTQILQMVRQLAPLVRFDGYHVLADLTGVPDLFQRIGPTLLGLLPWRWGSAESRVLKPWARLVVTVWVLVVVPLLLACLTLMVVALPRVLGTAWASLEEQWGMLLASWAEADMVGAGARVLGVLAIAFPVAGLLYIVMRVVRRAVGAVWRGTRGKPVQRALSGLVAGALVAGLLWAWWPSEDRYRPITPYERGTVLDAAPASLALPPAQPAGELSRMRTIWPASMEMPTAERPVLALVLIPSGSSSGAGSTTVPVPGAEPSAGPSSVTTPAMGTDDPGAAPVEPAPSWVFPFDMPDAPGAGDNQALAVNTQDGSVLYDVAFALVWVEDGPVLNTNESYAFASCRDCTTVAVSFQVVLVAGQVDVVVPQNISAAVNYNCVECLTYALATQLVVTVDGPLSTAGMDAVEELWAEIAAFGADLEGLALAEIRDRLSEYEARLIDIIEQDREPASSTPEQDAGDGAGTEERDGDGAGAAPTDPSGAGTDTDGEDVGAASDAGGTEGSPSSPEVAEQPTGDPTPQETTAPDPEPTSSPPPTSSEPSPTPTEEQESSAPASATATPSG